MTPDTTPAPRDLRTMLEALPTATLRAAYDCAKARDKGLRPFFADARAMIALRNEVSRRNAGGEQC